MSDREPALTGPDDAKEAWLAAHGDVLEIGEDGKEQPAPTFEEVLAQLEALPD
jgi:hypothetical protein